MLESQVLMCTYMCKVWPVWFHDLRRWVLGSTVTGDLLWAVTPKLDTALAVTCTSGDMFGTALAVVSASVLD